jgi:acetyl esterase/lipase
MKRLSGVLLLTLILPGVTASSADTADDGSVEVGPFVVPLSDFITPRAKEVILKRESWAASGFTLPPPGSERTDIRTLRTACALQSKKMIARLERQYPVALEHKTIAGIPAEIVTPKAGVAARNVHRVLINLHGGGMIGKCPDGLVESIPIAGAGNFKVITIDYRLAPEFNFPAASEDVTAVFRELLKEYPAQNIGFYGCSAGGSLAGQATAWLLKEGLPHPGAIGVFCAGMTYGLNGDSAITSQFVQGDSPQPIVHLMTYLRGADRKDPMVSPALSLELLAKFPPVLFITATRDPALSSALFSHNQLAKAGIESQFYAWDGLWHSFLLDDLPEAGDANKIIVHFFDQYLGTEPKG